MNVQVEICGEGQRYRFTLRALLIATTIVCLLLTPFHWLGWGYLFSLVSSAILVAACVGTYRESQPVMPLFISGLATGGGFCIAIGSISLFLHAGLNFLVCLICIPIKPQPRNFLILEILVALVPFAFLIKIGLDEHARLMALRDEYPIESLQERLEFDHQSAVREVTSQRSAISLSQEVDTELAGFETELAQGKRHWRIRSLEELHDDTYARFRFAAGFGSLRMEQVSEYSLKAASYIELPLPLEVDSSFQLSSPLGSGNILHHRLLENVFAADSFGAVETKSRVVGFAPHRTTENLKLGPRPDGPTESAWKLVRLELVGLLRHEEPRVYLAESLPSMDKVADLPTRALDSFETESLSQLRSAKDVVIAESPEQIRMLGAVRAAQDCLQCHEGSRGKLLGAFSYEFGPNAAEPQEGEN